MRAASLGFLTAALAALTAGCGGGSGDGSTSDAVTVTTRGSGSLNAVAINPAPGSTFIGTSTAFATSWAGSGTTPPAQFTVLLEHFLEPRGGEPLDLSTQKITVTQTSDLSWTIVRRDNLMLDAGGVYILDLSAPGGQQVLSTFIVGLNPTARSVTSVAATRSATDTPGTGGSLSGLQISPAPGSTFISKNTIFQLTWPGSVPPPSQFTASLRRYKEARGSDEASDVEQQVTMSRQGNSFVWNLRRADNLSMDVSGTYYLEITDPQNEFVQAAYTVSSDH